MTPAQMAELESLAKALGAAAEAMWKQVPQATKDRMIALAKDEAAAVGKAILKSIFVGDPSFAHLDPESLYPNWSIPNGEPNQTGPAYDPSQG